MKKLFILFTFIAVLLVGLAACDNNEASNNNANTDDTTSTAANNNDSGSDSLDVLEIFINFPWFPIDHFEGIIPDAIREATGVDLNITIATDPAQLGLMIASGDLPDLVWTQYDLHRLSDSRVTMSYDDLVTYHGAHFDDVTEEAMAIGRNFSSDGSLYVILNYFNNAEEWSNLQVGAPGQAMMAYRRDLLEAIGIDGSAISSVDELLDVLIDVRDAYPNHIPFGLGGFWQFQGIGNALGVPGARFNPTTGEYNFITTTPQYRELLEIANRMYREGLISIEHYANENEGVSHQFAFNDEVVFYNWWLSYADYRQLYTETRNIHPEAEWAILPFLGDEGYTNFHSGWSGVFVSRNVSNPEAAARLLSFLHSEEGRRLSMWGREGTEFTMGDNGVPQFSDEFIERRSAGEMNSVYNTLFHFGGSTIHTIYRNVSGIDPDILAAITTHGVGFQTFPEVTVAQPQPSSNEGVTLALLNEINRVHEPLVIFASTDEEFEQAYEAFMAALEEAGLRDFNAYMTEAIRETRERLGW